MKNFFVFSILIHGMLGTVLFALYEPAVKSETAQPIWITLVESGSLLPPAAATRPPLPTTETVSPLPVPFAPAVFQESLSEPVTKTSSEMEESLPPAVEGVTSKTTYNFNMKNIEFKVFLDEVRSRINQAKHYPWFARLRGVEGTAQLRFRILPSGEPAEIEIAQSSRSRLLDQEAIATVKRVARFPQPPMASNLGVVVRLPLVFQLSPPMY